MGPSVRDLPGSALSFSVILGVHPGRVPWWLTRVQCPRVDTAQPVNPLAAAGRAGRWRARPSSQGCYKRAQVLDDHSGPSSDGTPTARPPACLYLGGCRYTRHREPLSGAAAPWTRQQQ